MKIILFLLMALSYAAHSDEKCGNIKDFSYFPDQEDKLVFKANDSYHLTLDRKAKNYRKLLNTLEKVADNPNHQCCGEWQGNVLLKLKCKAQNTSKSDIEIRSIPTHYVQPELPESIAR